MRIGYVLREGFSNLRRATLASFVAITIICIALSLLSLFLLVTANISYLIEDIRSRVELEAFLDKALDTESAPRIQSAIRQVEGVDSLSFISKAQAARILKSIMGEEDIFDLVESNPLPASFRIRLLPEYRNASSVARIARELETVQGVEEVNYQKELLEVLDERVTLYNRISLGVGGLAALASIFLISNTIKLSIYAKRDLIKSMKLVGATHAFIATPFIVEGVLQGLVGGGLAVGLSYGGVYLAQQYVFDALTGPWEVYAILAGSGLVLGFAGSLFAVRFFLKESISDM